MDGGGAGFGPPRASREICRMKGNELIKRLQHYAKARGLRCEIDEKRGKGSHITLYLGDKTTILRNPKDELKTGTFHAILKQLGLTQNDLV